MSRHPGNLKLYRTTVEALRAAGRLDTADLLLTLAEGMYPESAYVASARAEVRAAIQHREAASLAALATRAPAEDEQRPKTLPELVGAVDSLAQGGHPEEALRLIAQVRRASPEILLGDKAGELVRRELDLCVRSRDLPLLQLTVRTFLKGRSDRARAALDLAKTWHARGDKDAALLTVREIIKHRPGDDDAVKTLVGWEPKPEKIAPASEISPST